MVEVVLEALCAFEGGYVQLADCVCGGGSEAGGEG